MINKVILIGNLGKDPKIKYTRDNKTAITKFSLATTEKWKDKNNGVTYERTEWHNITAFGRLAEICKDYLFKGKQVCIEGKIQTRSYEKDGIKKYNTEIIASTMEMLDSKNSADQKNQNPESTVLPKKNE